MEQHETGQKMGCLRPLSIVVVKLPLGTCCPVGGGVKTIQIDLAHTYAIAGWGKEQVASLLVLVSVRCSLFGNGGYEDQLNWAFDSFSEWCRLHSKTSTIHEFSKKELKISSLLEKNFFFFLHGCFS